MHTRKRVENESWWRAGTHGPVEGSSVDQQQPAQGVPATEDRVAIGGDAPIEKPEQDEFGYWPFAKALSRAIRTTPSPKGLVMSLNGPWGSGKSSLINLIRHDLATLQAETAPLIVEFNPWWFSGSEQLATQLLTQLNRRLRLEGSESLRKIGDLIGEYSGSLATVVSTAAGIPLLDKPIKFLLSKLKRTPADVRTMKGKLSEAMAKLDRRILIVVDDIDRLTPVEMMEVFKVVKGLGDLPNVIYLLVFDWTVVASALQHQLRTEGSNYLEKIVQSPFTLPAVSQVQLDRKFQLDLTELVDRFPHDEVSRTYFGNVYLDGLQTYLRKPRDVVRVMNALQVTYPPVAAEINPVDFVALEFLRVFEPTAYATLRDNSEMFTGTVRDLQGERERIGQFHEAWLARIDASRRQAVRALMLRLFPKVEAALGRMNYDADWLLTWRREKRLCAAEMAPVYFSFGVPDYVLSHAEANRVVQTSADMPLFVATWEAARREIRPDGHSKALDLLDHLQHLPDSTSATTAMQLLQGVLAVPGDVLPSGDEGRGFGIGTTLRVDVALRRLIRLIPADQRVQAIREAVHGARALGAAAAVIETLVALRDHEERELPEGIADADVAGLQQLLMTKLQEASIDDLLQESGLAHMIYLWAEWAPPELVQAKLAPALDNSEQLKLLIERCSRVATIGAFGDRVAGHQVRIHVDALRRVSDDAAALPRVEALLAQPGLSVRQRQAAEQYRAALRGERRVDDE